MPVPGNYLHNVRVDIYTSTYASAVRRTMLSATPVATSLYGHIQSIAMALENKMTGNIDADRVPKFRLFLETTGETDPFVKTGCVVKVTHTRHKASKAWIEADEEEVYLAEFVTDDITNSFNKSLALIKKKTQA